MDNAAEPYDLITVLSRLESLEAQRVGQPRMDRLRRFVEALRVLALTDDPNRAVLIEKAIEEYLNDKSGIVSLSLKRLCNAIDREEAEKTPIEDWSLAKEYIRSRLRRLA